MDKYLIKRPRTVDSSNSQLPSSEASGGINNSRVEFNPNDIVSDPGLRKSIEDFDIMIRDQVRREYLTRGPCQPIAHNYPKKNFSNVKRSFRPTWFKNFEWLEYSISKDAAFCFCCYLFGNSNRVDAFTKKGFSNWKKALEKFQEHVGTSNSAHNDARIQLQGFQNQRQSVSHILLAHGQEMEVVYRIRLTAALDVTRLLLKQGLPFRGHDESSTSSNKGNFLEFFEWYSLRNEEVGKVVNENAPGNNQMTSPKIQKELATACAVETTLAIINDIGDKIFSIMVDESRDVSIKEQMGVVLRYVNNHGDVIERFLGVVHVPDTSSISLKNAIDELFAKHKLSLSRLRGQGYDGASNMRGEFNGLKALILKENPYARYIHCFSHQLQLVVVAVARSNRIVSDFFQYVIMIVNVAGASCKRKDKLRQLEHDRIVKCLEKGEIVSGKGKNQETSLRRPGDTRWGSHYITILRLISMWTSVLEVLENVHDDGTSDDNSGIAISLIDKMENYEFVFVMHLMKYLLGITNDLSLALQQKDQNIVHAVRLIGVMKARLQDFREAEWDNFLKEVNIFCEKNMIPIINMEDNMRSRGRSRRNGQIITNFHHYRVEIFCQVVDSIVQEMNNRFSEASTELLLCISCLDPSDSFSKFDKNKLLRLAELYPEDFSVTDRMILGDQLINYIYDMRSDNQFIGIEGLGSLAKKLIETRRNMTFTLVYRLIELALIQSSFFWGYLLTQIAGGIWADTVGGKRVLAFGVVWWSIATALTPVAAKIGLPFLLVVRALMGIGEGVAMPAMNNLLSKWVPVSERSRSLALVYSGMYLGSVTGLAFSPFLIHQFGWPSVFYSFGSLGTVWVAVWLIKAQSSPLEDPELRPEEKKLILSSRVSKEPVKTIPWRSILSKGPVWALIVSHFCHNWGTFILLTWMPTYYNQVLKFNLTESGLLCVLPWLTMAFSANLGGWIADTLVSKGVSVTSVRKIMQTIGFLGPAFFLTQLSHVNSPAMAVLCMACSQGTDAFSQSGLYSNHQDIAPRYSGVLLGLSNTAGVLAGVFGTAATGYILQHGSWDDVFKVSVSLYLVGTVVWNLFSTGEKIID